MGAYYTYLVSSLPMLFFGMKPPLSFERFCAACEGLIPEEALSTLRSVAAFGPPERAEGNSVLARWRLFDTTLRNELAKLRAASRHRDPAPYLRYGVYAEPAATQIASSTHRNLSILDAERTLDQERWKKLGELEFGHYFDLDILVVYALKLLILERWDAIGRSDKARAVERVVQAPEGAASTAHG